MVRAMRSPAAALCAALLCGCVAAGTGPGASAPAGRPAPDRAALAIEAYAAALEAPGDGEALRRALDQVELALAVAIEEHELRPDLRSAEADLVARLEQLAGGGAQEEGRVTPSGAAPAAGVLSNAPASPGRAEGASATPIPGRAEGGPAASDGPVAATGARPRTPAPAAPGYAVATRKSFEGSGNSGQYASCIDVQILGRDGPVAGAVIGINNGDLSYQDQTDQGGYSGRCGLGASTWSVVLFWTPGGGQAQGAATTVYLSGAPEQRAAVVFQQR